MNVKYVVEFLDQLAERFERSGKRVDNEVILAVRRLTAATARHHRRTGREILPHEQPPPAA